MNQYNKLSIFAFLFFYAFPFFSMGYAFRLFSMGDETLRAQFGKAASFEQGLSLFSKERPSVSLTPNVLQGLRYEYFYAAPSADIIPFIESPHISYPLIEKFFVISNRLRQDLFEHHPHIMIEKQMFGARNAYSSFTELFSKTISPLSGTPKNSTIPVVTHGRYAPFIAAGAVAVIACAWMYYVYQKKNSKKICCEFRCQDQKAAPI